MTARSNAKKQQDKHGIPVEIDIHYQIFGKHAWEVEYGERCTICNKRIDEYGFCACGSVQ